MVLSAAVTLLFAEGIARAVLGSEFTPGERFGPSWAVSARFDSDYGWSNRPGARARVHAGDFEYHVRINSAGWRDVERNRDSRPGVQRIVCLGDSMAWGWGVEAEERFTDRLEQLLAPDVEVLNLAVPGYGTDQELLVLLERGLAYRPAVVLLAFVFNDVPEAERTENYGMAKPWFERDASDPSGWSLRGRPVVRPSKHARAWLAGAQAHSALLRILCGNRALLPSGVRQQNIEERPKRAANVRAFAERLVDPASPTRMLLERMNEASRTAGAELVAVALPLKHDAYLYEPLLPAPEAALAPGFRCELSQRLADAGAALGFTVVAVDAALLAACRTGAVLHVGDGHYNGAGHRAVAETLAAPLRLILEQRRKVQ